MNKGYRIPAAVALFKAILHVLFGSPIEVARFGSMSWREDGYLEFRDFHFHDPSMTGRMMADGVRSTTHPDLLRRAAVAVAVTLVLGKRTEQ